jgi:hypothetical protein
VEAHVTATRARDAGPGDVEHCTRGSSDKGDLTKCTRRATAKATQPRAFDSATATRARGAGPGAVEHCTRGSSDKGDVTKCTRRATAKATQPRAFDGGIDGVARDNDWGGVVPDSTARGAASGNIWTPSADHTGWDTTMPRTVDEWCRQPPVQRERQNDAISGER